MKFEKILASSFLAVILMVTSAHAVTKIKKIVATTSQSVTGDSYGDGTITGSYVAVSGCDKIRVGVATKTTNGSTNSLLYVDSATSSTSDRYARSAALGTVGGKGQWFMRDATSAINMPYARFVLSYTSGFTGSTEMWCVYNDGSQ
jgi:hypothetical protein